MDLETTGLYALGLPVIAAVLALEALVARRRGLDAFGFAETLSNLSAGLGTLIIGLFVGPVVLALYERAHALAPVRWDDSLWRWPLAFLIVDACYYAWHRSGHRFALLWTIHGVHHQHERLNGTVGLRLEWLADAATIFFFAPLPLLGIDSTTGFLAIALLSFYTLTTHSPALARPTFGLLVTPATHGSHHSRDARYADKNFGAMLCIWDRLLGTHLEPAKDERLRADVPSVCRVHDGVRAQWSLIPELAAALRRAPTLGARLRLLLSPPALLPDAPTPRDDAALDARTRAYLALAFALVVALGAWLLWLRDAHPLAVRVAGALVTLWGLRTIGGLLDGRAGARREEALRLAATLVYGLGVGSVAPAAGAVIALGASASLVLLRAASASPSPSSSPAAS